MSGRLSRLGALLRDAARLDRTQSDPVVAGRNALGIVAPLVIATLAGATSAGLPSTIGALQTAFADRPGPYRLRLIRMLGTAAAAATTSALAVLASRSNLGSVALLLVLGFVAGLLLAGGPSATQVGVASVASALILGHIPEPPGIAVHVGLLVFAGGAGQALLAVVGWPLGRHRPERIALAALYRELAKAARLPAGTSAGPQVTTPIDDVRKIMYGLGHDHGPSVEAYRVLLDEAQRIRREIIVLSSLVERLDADDELVAAGSVRAAMGGTGDVLDRVSAALADGRPIDPSALTPVRAQLRQAVARLTDVSPSRGELTRRAAAARLRALSGQLRAVVETSEVGASEGLRSQPLDLPGGFDLRDPVAILRANLTPDSAVLRHALRVAMFVAGSDLVVRLAGYGRGYWVPLTILVVLRPDFASTFQRSVMRVSGTIVGLLLASELVRWFPGSDWYQIALIGVFAFALRFAGPGNLALIAVSLSGLVVVLLALDGVSPHDTLIDRSVDTLIGGALALAATLLLAVWERDLVPARLAALLAAYREYLEILADPAASIADRQRARAASRLARTNAQASVDRARAEPVTGQAAVDLGEGVLANSHRVVHALMTIDSVRAAVYGTGRLPELDEFLRDASAALRSCEDAVLSGAAPRPVPGLRTAQDRLRVALEADLTRAGGVDAAGALADATDRLANAIDTLISELRRRVDVTEAAGTPARPR
jgi:uncharacterized membrane protein YccC